MERIPTATEVPYSPASEDVPLSAPIDTGPYRTLYGVGPKPVTVYGYVDPTGGVAFVDSISVSWDEEFHGFTNTIAESA